ncbi:MAG: DinB family protein [Anaerolineae bacterium]|nr:DinB family protein [Anaerolineae bacterium]
MTGDDFRQLYDYHFKFNRLIWDHSVAALSDEQLMRDLGYSHGSLHSQIVHLMSIDERWFSGLRGVDVPDFLDSADFPDRPSIRAKWDMIEADMRGYLTMLTDTQVSQPFNEMKVWQVLFHVLNHGTDHRAQMLSMLSQLGAPTFPQDFVFYVWGVDVTKPR